MNRPPQTRPPADEEKNVEEFLEELRVARSERERAPALTSSPASGIRARSYSLLRLLETAVDHLHDLVFITEAEPRDGGRRIVFVNQAFLDVSGYTAEEVIGKTPNLTIGPKTDRSVLSRIEARLKARRPVHEELLKYRKDGTCYWVEIDILPVWGDDGQLLNWVSVQRDITERKSIELRLLESERLAAVGSVVSSIGRDLDAPLARLNAGLSRATAELAALAGADPAEVADRLSRLAAALSGAREATARIDGAVHDLARLSRPRQEVRARIDVRDLLETAVNLVSPQLRKNAQLVRELEEVPRVLANATRLAQALANLLVNAIEAVPPGDVRSNVIRVATRRAELDRVVIEVEDNGWGVRPDVRDRIFESFFTTKPNAAHAGLGLSACREIVADLGGAITFESEEGRTVFRVTLPAAPRE